MKCKKYSGLLGVKILCAGGDKKIKLLEGDECFGEKQSKKRRAGVLE